MHDRSSSEMRRYAALARVLLPRPILEEADRIELEYYAVWFEARAERGVGLPGGGASVNFGSDAS